MNISMKPRVAIALGSLIAICFVVHSMKPNDVDVSHGDSNFKAKK